MSIRISPGLMNKHSLTSHIENVPNSGNLWVTVQLQLSMCMLIYNKQKRQQTQHFPEPRHLPASVPRQFLKCKMRYIKPDLTLTWHCST